MALVDHNDGFRFRIGDDPKTGKPKFYDGERGLCTIAPPGSGKTQCHILTNLLTFQGPAVVLDVTGNLWKQTSAQRSKFGPVYKIDVENPAASDHYNPFSFIRRDAENLWGDALTFANLLYSKSTGTEAGNSDFFRLATPQYLSAMAAFIVTHEPVERHNCETLLRYVSGKIYDGFADAARRSDQLGLSATADMLANADKDTRGNVMWTAKNCLSPWEEPKIASISRVSDWHPSAIRANNATLYLCVSLERIKDAPAYVRLILGQHLTQFMRQDTDQSQWVQLFVDEAPQLRHMDVLVTAIEAGRNHRVRVWLAMQWRGQLVAAYGKETAEGMIGACGLTAYMNPPLEDGTAKHVSDQVGIDDDRISGRQQPRIAPQLLAGRKHTDDVLAFEWGGNFHVLKKRFAHDDKSLSRLVGAAP